MSFQILDSSNNPIPINELDKQAAEFWGKEVDSEGYASPIKRKEDESRIRFIVREMRGNWFDNIGFKIHQGNESWTRIKELIIDPYRKLIETNQCTHNDLLEDQHVGGLLKLVDHWLSLGYIPKQIIN